MAHDLTTKEVLEDEYTKKVQALYAILNLNEQDYISLEQLSMEYENCLQNLQIKNFFIPTSYLNR